MDNVAVLEVLTKARKMKGLTSSEVKILLDLEDYELEQELFKTAHYVKESIYGKRIVLFAPLYVGNKCNNECLYCAFRKSNKELDRTLLNKTQLQKETECLIEQGHKRLLLVAGEEGTKKELDYILDSIKSIYSVKTDKGSIKRINVNIAPLDIEGFKKLAAAGIGTYQCFQETYNKDIYKRLHPSGPKSDYQYRLKTMDRAYLGGLHDVGIGVLFGLAPWKEEVLALIKHGEYLEKEYGIGPHTISVPRIEDAHGSEYSKNPLYPVSDRDFLKIIAILRLAVPYTGIILSTRESAEMRKKCLDLGISQMSAGSKTDPGGYNQAQGHSDKEQFSIADERSLCEVIKDVVDSGHIPSFCTGCYRRGRVGKDFMDLAKPGLIKKHCLTNALATFYEYILDFGDEELKKSGRSLMAQMIEDDITNVRLKRYVHDAFIQIDEGKRDVYL